MKFARFLICLLCIVLLLCLCSCVEEESEETLKMPEIGSMVEYRISDTEYLRILYKDGYSNYGEWIKDGETTRLYVETEETYWGIFAARYGITKLNVVIRELTFESHNLDAGRVLATTDEGFLNSTTLTVAESGEILPITEIKVTENYEGNFDWATPEWKEFCSPRENEFYEIEKLSVKIDSVTRQGEWRTNGSIIPVKMVFDEWFCWAEIYDISGEQDKKVFLGKGHIENGVLIIDEMTSVMFYENSVTDIKITKTADPFAESP